LTSVPTLPAQVRLLAQDYAPEYSPYLDRQGREKVYWGDTHLHTQYSTDAGMIGTTLRPEDAYRFAMGEEVTSSSGVRARLVRPLDFLVVSDHAENLGLPIAVKEAMPALLDNPWGRQVYDLSQSGDGYAAFYKWAIDGMLPGLDPLKEPSINADIWQRQVTTADQFNKPGYFTALIGYEWTTTRNAKNLHRVVIFRDDASKAGQIVPFSSFDSPDPEDLWTWLEDYEHSTQGQVLAIPHNGNLSNGLMFAPTRKGKGKVKTVGSTVNFSKATYSNEIGAVELRALWTDPDFDKTQRAFYYARVLEIPTPSWQAYDARAFGDEFPESVKMSIQDRAYTSPIWYTPPEED
ncbi:MAG: DUF3604 domain-containing protein, partial [Lysobacterales bacterium]